MELRLLAEKLSVCKLGGLEGVQLEGTPLFLARTEKELSLVCESGRAPAGALAVEGGFRAFEVAGPLDFALVGILARLTGALAEGGVPVFAVSTYDTDYLLVKEDKVTQAVELFKAKGWIVKNND